MDRLNTRGKVMFAYILAIIIVGANIFFQQLLEAATEEDERTEAATRVLGAIAQARAEQWERMKTEGVPHATEDGQTDPTHQEE